MTTTIICLNILDGKGRGAKDNKWTDRKILGRYVVPDLKVIVQEQARMHILQIQ